MKYGIWTGFYLDLTPEEALRHLATYGWRDIELCSEHMEALLGDDHADSRLRGLREIAAGEGITLWQAHLLLPLDLARFDEKEYMENLDTAKRWLDGFALLNIPNIVIHPGGFSENPRSEADWRRIQDLNYSAFRSLGEHIAGTSLRLCLENLFDHHRERRRRFGARIGDLLDIIGQVGNERIGICLDTGHAHVQGLHVPTAIQECGPYLWATHISDNDGKGDQHLLPYGGTLDWEEIVAALYDIGYNGLWNLEIPGEEHAPCAIRDLKLDYAHRLLEHMLLRGGNGDPDKTYWGRGQGDGHMDERG